MRDLYEVLGVAKDTTAKMLTLTDPDLPSPGKRAVQLLR